jgi:hypothetical protein
MFDIIAHHLFYSERKVSVCIVTLYSVFVLCFFYTPYVWRALYLEVHIYLEAYICLEGSSLV